MIFAILNVAKLLLLLYLTGFWNGPKNRCEKKSTKRTAQNLRCERYEQKCKHQVRDLIKSVGISGFSTIFDWLVLEAQRELDNVFGHFWYLLIVKRSFLAIIAVPGDSRVPNLDIEDSRIWQNLICTTLVMCKLVALSNVGNGCTAVSCRRSATIKWVLFRNLP